MERTSRVVGHIATCFALALPFVLCDLYYAYTDATCTALPIPNHPTWPSRGVWLKVDGYLALATIVLHMLLAIVYYCCGTSVFIFICYMILTVALQVLNITWFSIGGFMFWGYLYPNSLCQGSVQGYVFARLVLGFILIVVNLFTLKIQ